MFTTSRRYRWLLATCGLLTAGAVVGPIVVYWKRNDVYWLLARQPTSEELTNVLGGSQVVAILRKPDRVEAARIAPPTFERSWEPIEYEELEIKEKVPAEIAADISHVLVTPAENREDDPVSCVPIYGVRVSFFQGMDRVDVYFCFECGILAVHLNDKAVGGNHFRYRYQRLIRDVQQLFPYDQRLAKLANERRH